MFVTVIHRSSPNRMIPKPTNTMLVRKAILRDIGHGINELILSNRETG